mmetsp:Transcript_24180/g.75993  ORF Transcript_24180/g.75993 Transcript_24180/m.75993 type:complete len:80 (-) Transcript_24180:193-432(-)
MSGGGRLCAEPEAWAKALGTKCLHFTWGARGGISLDGLGLELVTSPEQGAPPLTATALLTAVYPGCRGGWQECPRRTQV